MKTPASRPGFFGMSLVIQGNQGSEAGLQNGGWLEANRLGGSDCHRFTRLRVAALAGGALLHLEGAEADDLDFLVLFNALGDGIEDCIDCFVGCTLGNVFSQGFLDGFYEFGFVHGSRVCASGFRAWQEKIRLWVREFFLEVA